MSGNSDPSRKAYVPVSFEELQRSSASRAPVRPAYKAETADMTTLAMNPGVMRQNKIAIFAALAIFLVVGGIFYFKPMLDTIAAFNTAGGIAADKAMIVADKAKGASGTISSLGADLAHAKDVDSKAVGMGLKGVGCLNATLGDGKACAK